jgi:REP element-mobilizing transposase RayT
MSRNYKFRNPEGLYFISFATVYWVDVFIRPNYRNILLKSIQHCQKEKGLLVYAWVIMSSHVHMIISSKKDKLPDIIRDLKKFSSKSIINEIKEYPRESRKEWMLWMFEQAGKKNANNTKYQFWQQHNQPIELVNATISQQKLNYLHNNPVEEGLVINAEDYKYSSAIDYAEGKGLIDIDLLF